MIIKTIKTFFIRGFGASAAFLLTLVVTNNASIDDAGLFLFCLAIVNFIATLLVIGSPQVLIRIVAANSDGSWRLINRQFSVILKIVLCLCFISAFIFYFSNQQIAHFIFNKPLLASLLPLTGMAIILFSLQQLFSAVLQGTQRVILASIVQSVIMPAAFIVAVSGFIYIKQPLYASNLLFLYVICLSLAVGVGVAAWLMDSRSKFSYVPGLPAELRDSLVPLFIVTSMTLCAQWAGQFSVGKYLPASDVALFAAAQRTALLASFVLIAVNLVVAPKFANAFARNNSSEVNKLSLLSSRLMMVMAAPVLLFMFFFPGFLMSLFGNDYIKAAPLLQIMAVGQFINVITGSVAYLLVMTNHEKDFRNVVLLSGPLSIVLAFALTKQYGLIGAAYATAISIATQNLLAVVMVKRRLGFNTLNIFRKIDC